MKYLIGARMPTEENLQKMAKHLGINLHWLLTGEGEMFIKKDPQVGAKAELPYTKDTEAGKGFVFIPNNFRQNLTRRLSSTERCRNRSKTCFQK